MALGLFLELVKKGFYIMNNVLQIRRGFFEFILGEILNYLQRLGFTQIGGSDIDNIYNINIASVILLLHPTTPYAIYYNNGATYKVITLSSLIFGKYINI